MFIHQVTYFFIHSIINSSIHLFIHPLVCSFIQFSGLFIQKKIFFANWFVDRSAESLKKKLNTFRSVILSFHKSS